MQHFRPSFEDGEELLGAGDGIVTVLIEDPAFGLLCGAELFGQLIALEYENVRINAAAFSQSGQQLILTGKFRYLFVQLNDIHAPEEFPFTDTDTRFLCSQVALLLNDHVMPPISMQPLWLPFITSSML
ncbi:hypothetical protein [Vescimonas sp.]|uniref:hypothetical protein n=1 Tax=Vescimonas sp. TaxID=2892404 RepID=UPI003F80EA06